MDYLLNTLVMKSKKTLLISALFVLSMLSMPAFSQIRLGVKAGVDLENPTFSDAFKVENMTSYYVGPALEAMFPFAVVDFGLEAALLYSDNRMTVTNLTEGNGDKDVANRYLMLPVNAKVKVPLGSGMFKVYGVAGPYAAYLISGDKIDFQSINEEIKAQNFEAGVNLGLGFELFRKLQIGANYKVKLTDNYATDKPQWDDPLNGKSSTWSLSAAFFF